MAAIGRRVYGLGAIVLGIPGLALGQFAAMGLPVPAQVPGGLAYVSAAWLVLAGLAANLRRTAAAGSVALAAFFGLWLAVLHLPNAAAKPLVWVSWEGVAEALVMTLGGVLAWMLAGEGRGAALGRFVQPAFGAGLVVFGISEFVYAKFTAAMVPAWLPPSQLAWAYATGAAQIAAGVAVISGVQAGLAAWLLTAMYLVFQVIVHAPRVIADPSAAAAWAENGVNLVLAGAAWALAEWLGESPLPRRGRG